MGNLALIDFGSVPDWIAAGGSVGTMVVAVAAAIVAYKQVKESRQLREDQARPFVVVDFEVSPVGHPYMDLVIQNIGATLAKDVRITFDPPLSSSISEKTGENFLLKEMIPSIPPGKRYVILFDNMPERYKRSDLPSRYKVTVEMNGPHGKEEPLVQVLDLDTYYDLDFIEVHGLHHLAKTMRAWASAQGVERF